MVHAKNYETVSTFVKVVPLASFFLDTVYLQICGCFTNLFFHP